MHNVSSTTAPVRKTNTQHLKHRHLKMHRYISQQSFCCVCVCVWLTRPWSLWDTLLECGEVSISTGCWMWVLAGPQACGLKWFDLFVACWGSRQVSGSSWAPRVLWPCSQLVLGGRLRLESAASCSWFSGAPAFWLWALHLGPPSAPLG